MNTTGIVFDIKKYAIHDGPGIRTTVFFKGCPLSCWWCHNPESRNPKPETFVKINHRRCLNSSYSETREVFGRAVTVAEVVAEVKKDIPFYDESGGGVTFSGGEPLLQPDFLYELLGASKELDLHTTVDTTGFADWSVFEKICDKVDLFLYDLKLMDDSQHKKYTAVNNKRIHENLRKLDRKKANVCIRIPLIPGITDTKENLLEIAVFVSSLKHIKEINLLPYNPANEGKYERLDKVNKIGHLEIQTDEEMLELKNTFKPFGLNVSIGG